MTDSIGDYCCGKWVRIPTLDGKLSVEQYISERTYKPIVLRFWAKMWCLTHLCGYTWPNVDDPPDSPHDPTIINSLGIK
jgi:hypothetical protein